MKKVLILSLAAILMVVSGVAAVSAYEAHIINVTAKVENALTVTTTAVDFGTVFPQEFIKYHRDVGLSTSAIAELGSNSGDLDYVTIQPYAEWKVDAAKTAHFFEDPDWVAYSGYWEWLGECLYVGFDASQSPDPVSGLTLVGPAAAAPPSAQAILTTADLASATPVSLDVAIDAPVFAGYYNALTDVDPKPSGLSTPTWVIPEDDPRHIPGGSEMGLDLKIQVINIVRW